MASELALLIERLGLDDTDALEIFQLDPLSAIAGAVEHRPEIGILLALSAEALERVGPGALRRWMGVRGGSDSPTPLKLLLEHDFAAFEDALGVLIDRGVVLRGGGG